MFNNFDQLNIKLMDKSANLLYVYCMNMQCQRSIYHNLMALQIPLSEGNLLSNHSCACCSQPLVSAIDLEINYMLANLNLMRPDFKNYMKN